MLKVIGDDERMDLFAYEPRILFWGIGSRFQEGVKRVRYLLDQGLNPNVVMTINEESITPLHFPIQYYDGFDTMEEIIKMFIEHPDIDLTIKNDDGMTPLELAKHLNHKLILEFFGIR